MDKYIVETISQSEQYLCNQHPDQETGCYPHITPTPFQSLPTHQW